VTVPQLGDPSQRVPVFDLDGTLLDSDAALTAPFVAMGLPPDAVPFGLPLDETCARLRISVEEYLAHYDDTAATPFPGVTALIEGLDRWAVCSNKHPRSGRAELARLGWQPDVALFTDAFGGPKELAPVLAMLDMAADGVVFVGDTAHDRHCAAQAGCPFILAGWNPRTVAEPGDIVAASPGEIPGLLAV